MTTPRKAILWTVALLWAVAVFVLDLLTPLGIAVWTLYVPVVLIAAPLRRPRVAYALAAACTAAMAAGLVLSPPGGSFEWGWKNRVMGLVALWLSGWAAAAIARRSRELNRALGEVRKEVRAREQSEAELRELTAQLEQRVADRTRELEEKHRRFEAILETAVEGVVTINERGIVDSFNRAAEKMFGYAAAEVIGRNVAMLMPSPDRERHDDYMAHYLRTGQAKIIGIGREVVAQRKDGTLFPMDLSVSEVRLGARRLFTALLRDNTERRRLEQEVAAAAEHERARIGRELHDGLGQQLGGLLFFMKGLHLDLQAAGSPQAETAAQLSDELSTAMKQARSLSHELYAVHDAPEGLVQALDSLAERATATPGSMCVFGGDRDLRIENRAVASHLYRIAQEAVHNALKHSGARQIEVEVGRRGSAIVLVVRDNGKGLGADAGHGLGLRTMDQRARLIGGELAIRGGPNGGVEVSCRVPAAIASTPGAFGG